MSNVLALWRSFDLQDDNLAQQNTFPCLVVANKLTGGTSAYLSKLQNARQLAKKRAKCSLFATIILIKNREFKFMEICPDECVLSGYFSGFHFHSTQSLISVDMVKFPFNILAPIPKLIQVFLSLFYSGSNPFVMLIGCTQELISNRLFRHAQIRLAELQNSSCMLSPLIVVSPSVSDVSLHSPHSTPGTVDHAAHSAPQHSPL